MPDALVSLEQLKAALLLEASETDQDHRLEQMIPDAQAAIESHIDRSIDETWPEESAPRRLVARRAVMMLIQHWLEQGPEAALPQAVEWLCHPLQRFSL